MYRDTCIGDTSIDTGIDLTPIQSIVYRYRLTLFSSIVYRYRLTQKLSIAPISGDWHVSDVPSFSDHMCIRFRVQSGTKRTKMIRNVRRTCWNKYTNERDHRLHDLNSSPVSISSVDNIEKLASTVQSQIIKSYNVSCPQRKIRRKTDNIWWNTELTCLRRKARKAQRKAIKSKLGNDWEAFKQAQLIFKNAVRKAKRDSWHLFTKSMNSHCATARLAKIMRRNETMQVSNVLRPNGEFTESSVETMNCLQDTLAPGSREENYCIVKQRKNQMITLLCYQRTTKLLASSVHLKRWKEQ